MNKSISEASAWLATPSTDIEKRLCATVPEVTKMIGVPRNGVCESVRHKELPVVRFSKRTLIPRVALGKMLEKAGKVIG